MKLEGRVVIDAASYSHNVDHRQLEAFDSDVLEPVLEVHEKENHSSDYYQELGTRPTRCGRGLSTMPPPPPPPHRDIILPGIPSAGVSPPSHDSGTYIRRHRM